MREAQRYAAKAAAHRLDQKRPLARGQHYTGKAANSFSAHCISDHRKRFLTDLLAGHDVVRLLEISRVDLPGGKEALDLDCARVLRPRESDGFLLLLVFIITVGGALFGGLVVKAGGNGWRAFTAGRGGKLHLTRRRALASRLLKVSVPDQQKFVLADLIAARLVGCVDGLAGNGIECQRQRHSISSSDGSRRND